MVTLRVYDALGRTVSTLVQGAHQFGTYTVEFNGNSLAAGTYLCTLVQGGKVQTHYMSIR